MSNNLVSQYPISDRQLVQMEHGSNSLDFPVSEMKMVGQVSSNPESHRFYVSADQRGLLESISSGSGFNASLIPNNRLGHNESSGVSMGSNQVWMSDQLGQELASSPNSITGQKASFPVKRKAEVEPLLNSSTSQQLPQPHKRPAHMGSDANSPGYLQPSAQQRKTAQVQSRLGSPVTPSQPNKKMMRNDSISGKSGLQRGQTGKRQTAQIESASKVRSESSEAVRSKMRESLAAALALAVQNQENVLNTEKNRRDTNISHDPMDSQASLVSGSSGGGQVPVSGPEDVFPSNELTALNKNSDSQVFSAELPPGGSSRVSGAQTFQEFQYSLPDEDVPFGDNFFVKDDLLQGNGLSWAFDFDMHMGEGKETQHAEKPVSLKEEAPGHRQEVATLTPEDLAFKIETELFKLFDGVNKKYRERGRSLLFNLKDRNNPELRERVMSGEISPERLCSMSAEELASKELSEWRMAKAEELAQMKVLPDTEVDIRRLVRKTHKGEYQVEVERDDAMAAEVSGGTSVLTRPQRKKVIESHSPSGASVKDKERVSGQGNSSEGHDFSGSLIIPTDGTDPMQGMMVDELKDADLPPIVSLDEFMESLNNEPPFENLSGDAAQKSPISHGESPKLASNSRASNRASDIRKDATSKKASSVKKHDMTMDLSWSPAKETVVPNDVPNADHIWDGILQLNISSSVTVIGLFHSGEKTSIKEWPTSLEIKGRVRLDAFEKFLQELPMSRTRAVMVLHFVLRDKSSHEQRSNISEAISSYTADERLGYAEPVPGVELYLCPPASRMFDMLNKHILKERPESDKTIENGVIGVVVWRRAHISNTISPNSSSHQKHSLKRQPFGAPKRIQDSPNVNPNTLTRTPHVSKPQPPSDEDDDIPPGFGPGAAPPAAKDDDDLPEFNFSGDLNPSASRITSHNSLHAVQMTKRPVDQVRELIKKYGQGGPAVTSGSVVVDRSLGIEPWNDDDDDIPEWRPQAPQPPHHQPYPVAHGHPPPLRLHPALTQQPPSGLGHLAPPGGTWAPPPPAYLHGARWRQY